LQDIDWDSIQIDNIWEEEGQHQIFSEVVVYDKLDLKQEDENEAKLREEACHRSGPGSKMHYFDDELVCGDLSTA
jgi:hypothetical protein